MPDVKMWIKMFVKEKNTIHSNCKLACLKHFRVKGTLKTCLLQRKHAFFSSGANSENMNNLAIKRLYSVVLSDSIKEN